MTEIHKPRLPVVAIDGPSAAGKSTVARAVAAALGIRVFDTGLLYRTAALLALRNGVSPSDAPVLAQMIRETTIDLDPRGELQIDGENVSHLLRQPQVEAIVSEVSAHPEVRQQLFRAQRRIAESGSVVMVGRDITTVVAPDAAVRVYLDATPEERARRRFIERQDADPSIAYETILADLRERDRKDSSRETAPLQAAEGVTIISSDGKSVEEVAEEIVSLARKCFPQSGITSSAPMPKGRSDPPPEYLEGSRYSGRRKIVQAVNGWWIDLVSRMELVGEENIPPWGPLLYVSNHLHNFDPAIEFKAFPRPIHFMGKQELFRVPVFKQIAEASGGFPVDRGRVDREAL
ncbi:MAG: (d)CMP kinase, partial [Thermomicrobiales bacterium]